MSSNEAEQYKDEIKLLDRFSEKQKEDLMAARLENDRVQGILWRACHAILKRQHNMGDVLHQIMFRYCLNNARMYILQEHLTFMQNSLKAAIAEMAQAKTPSAGLDVANSFMDGAEVEVKIAQAMPKSVLDEAKRIYDDMGMYLVDDGTDKGKVLPRAQGGV